MKWKGNGSQREKGYTKAEKQASRCVQGALRRADRSKGQRGKQEPDQEGSCRLTIRRSKWQILSREQTCSVYISENVPWEQSGGMVAMAGGERMQIEEAVRVIQGNGEA